MLARCQIDAGMRASRPRSDVAASRRRQTLYHNPPADIIAANIRDFAAGRKVTFNIPIDAAGRINPAPLAHPRG